MALPTTSIRLVERTWTYELDHADPVDRQDGTGETFIPDRAYVSIERANRYTTYDSVYVQVGGGIVWVADWADPQEDGEPLAAAPAWIRGIVAMTAHTEWTTP